jgi:Domain of unknown function (DUF3597)
VKAASRRKGLSVHDNNEEQTMSIFGSIMSAITGAAKTIGAAASSATQPVTMAQVDVEAVLTKLSAEQKEKLNWRQSIVDLMKLLKLDSSLTARKQLAQELGYTGDTNDSATMNIWLHSQVMKKLAENGGKVPDSLKAA